MEENSHTKFRKLRNKIKNLQSQSFQPNYVIIFFEFWGKERDKHNKLDLHFRIISSSKDKKQIENQVLKKHLDTNNLVPF